MRIKTIIRILGILLMMYSLTMLPPIAVSLIYDDGEWGHFALTFGLILLLGSVIFFPVRRDRQELHPRDGFAVVVMFWSVLGAIGALPFMLGAHLSFVDAVFESMSGFTTTGASVITGLDQLPKSVLYYRQQLTLLGGIGVVVLAVAIIPLLGVGGMQLYRAETPGPLKEDKLTPRIAGTARAFSFTFLGLTAACALAYWAAGMDLFDAICNSFSTMGTAGFTTHDNSFAYWNSPLIELIAVIFLILGAINFSVHFLAWRRLNMRYYRDDRETRAFLGIIVFFVLIFTGILFFNSTYAGFLENLRYALFHVVSIITTTGFTTTNFSEWPLFLPLLLAIIAFNGGCAGSTVGGIKVVRMMLLYKQGLRELWRLTHPNGIFTIKIGKKIMPTSVMDAVWGFISLYLLCTMILTLTLMATGLEAVTAFSAASASINNMGVGLNELGSSFQSVSPFGKAVMIFGMLLGRLEIFTLLVLFSPAFWRR